MWILLIFYIIIIEIFLVFLLIVRMLFIKIIFKNMYIFINSFIYFIEINRKEN